MSIEYGKIIKTEEGTFDLNISKGVSFWEIDKEDDGKMSHVVIDIVDTYLAHKDIPILIEYLQTVYKARIK